MAEKIFRDDELEHSVAQEIPNADNQSDNAALSCPRLGWVSASANKSELRNLYSIRSSSGVTSLILSEIGESRQLYKRPML